MSEQTPGCGSTTDARKRETESSQPGCSCGVRHAYCDSCGNRTDDCVLEPYPDFTPEIRQLCDPIQRTSSTMIEELVEASSFGTPEAKAARETVPSGAGSAIALAAKYLGQLRESENRRAGLTAELQLLIAQTEDAFRSSPYEGWVLLPDLKALYQTEDAEALERVKAVAVADELREAAMDVFDTGLPADCARFLEERADRIEGGQR